MALHALQAAAPPARKRRSARAYMHGVCACAHARMHAALMHAVRRALTTSQALGIALAAIRAHLGLLARCGDSLSSRLGVDR